MPGRFSTGVTINGSAIGAFAVTPSATAFDEPIRQVTINGGGTITYTSSVDEKSYTTGVLPVGTYPLFASHITGGTATGITGWT